MTTIVKTITRLAAPGVTNVPDWDLPDFANVDVFIRPDGRYLVIGEHLDDDTDDITGLSWTVYNGDPWAEGAEDIEGGGVRGIARTTPDLVTLAERLAADLPDGWITD